ncbi:unknown protein (plasmid) [Calothrix sp. PCC 7716]|nr:unknown protein [Calothrix sp. PCC 7716]
MTDFDSNSHNSSVNELLPLDDDKIIKSEHEELENDAEENESDIDPAKIVTKHNFVTSPYVKAGFVGGFFLLGFGLVYLSLNTLMGGGNVSEKTPEATPTPTSTPFVAQQDGDAYAKLALQKQESDLKNLNGKQETQTETDKLAEDKNKAAATNPANSANNTTNQKTTNTTSTTNTSTRAPSPRNTATVASQPVTNSPPPRRVSNNNLPAPASSQPVNRSFAQTRIAQATPSRPIMPTIPKLFIPSSGNSSNNNQRFAAARNNSNSIERQSDPLGDIERLRNLSSMGRISYARKISSPTLVASANTNNSNSTTSSDASNLRRRRGQSNTVDTPANSNQDTALIENNSIQKLTPKWQPTTQNRTVEFRQEASRKSLVQVNYEPEESQILDERAPQYLVVGSTTNATLITPLLLAGDKPNKNLRFIAQLTQPIKSNTGATAIPAGTQMAITVNGIDGGFGLDAEVVGILKDGTEYPILPGTITALAKGGNPLIARPYKGKGGEIAGYDATLGAIAGLAKIGEVINRPDQSTTQTLPLGGTVTSTFGNQRNITGAFLEGAFGSLTSTVGARTRTATTEIINRPNVWYVPANTQITLRINRSVQL